MIISERDRCREDSSKQRRPSMRIRIYNHLHKHFDIKIREFKRLNSCIIVDHESRDKPEGVS